MPEELLLYQNNPESKLWTNLANDPSIIVAQLKPTCRATGRIASGSYIPNVIIDDYVSEAGIHMPLDGVFPVMAMYSLGRTMLIGGRNIMQYGNVQTLTPGLSIWELPKADNPVPTLIRSVRVAESGVIPNHAPGDDKRLLGHLTVSSTTDYLYATGYINNFSQYPVYIAAADDPRAGDILGGMRIQEPGRA